jgi:hypothetical protein
MLRMVGMFDDDVATADVIAKAIEPRRLRANELLELVRFFNAAIRDFDRKLHFPDCGKSERLERAEMRR